MIVTKNEFEPIPRVEIKPSKYKIETEYFTNHQGYIMKIVKYEDEIIISIGNTEWWIVNNDKTRFENVVKRKRNIRTSIKDFAKKIYDKL